MARKPRHGSSEEGKARILRAARERYLRGQRIELTQLAIEQGVGRATAYRWLGDNDRLLADILAERIRKSFANLLRANADKTGRDKVLGVVADFARQAARSDRLDSLLRRDQRRVLKILTTRAYGVHDLVERLFDDLISSEHKAGHIDLPVPTHTLAYGIVRLLGAHLYADILTGEKHNIDTAIDLIRVLIPARANQHTTIYGRQKSMPGRSRDTAGRVHTTHSRS